MAMPRPTFLASLTPPGKAALAVIGLSGPMAWTMVEPLFQAVGSNRPAPGQPRRYWLGRLAGLEISDQVVLTIDGDPACPRVELACHGGLVIVRSLMDHFGTQPGIRELTWVQWLRLHAAHALEAEAAAALARAPTTRMAEIILTQAKRWRESLPRWIAALESHEIEPIVQEWSGILDRWAWGQHVLRPWQVAVAGAVNAGKSSLVNALLGYARSIASPWEGTTRDVVTAQTTVDGWPVELIDTAGLRSDAAHEVEAAGIAAAEAAIASADGILWVMDASHTPLIEPPPVWQGPHCLMLLNKIDVLGESALPRPLTAGPVAAVSVEQRIGLEGLLQRCLQARLPSEEETLERTAPFTSTLWQSGLTMRDHLQAGNTAAVQALLNAWLQPVSWESLLPESGD